MDEDIKVRLERIDQQIAMSRQEWDNVKAFMLREAINMGERMFQLERRLDRLGRGGKEG